MVLALALTLAAAGQARAAKTVVLKPDTDRVGLGRTLEILEDKQGGWTIAQVASPAFDGRFAPTDTEEPAYGFTKSVYWARFELQSTLDHTETWLLELNYPLLDWLDLYVQRPDGSFEHRTGGDQYPFHHREVMHRNVVFPIKLQPGHKTQVYLRVGSSSSMQLPLVLWSRIGFQHKDHSEQVLLGIYYGIILVMVLFNLFVYFSIREHNYLVFVIYLSSYGVTQMALNGLAFEFLWPNAIWWANHCVPFMISFSIVTTIVFARSFLQTRYNVPRLDRVLKVLLWVYALYTPVSLFVTYGAAIRVSVAGCVVVPLMIVGTATYALYKGYRAARFFVLAWLAFFAGIVLHALLAYGVVPRTFLTENFHQIGSALLTVLLSFALGDRINIIKQEKEQAQARTLEIKRRSLEIERESKENLQREVDRQTEALRAANTQLQELDRQKTIFFQNISHELRSPLTVLLNPLERLLAADITGPPDLDVKQRLQAMERNTHRLLRLVNQLLDFSRLESGRSTLSFERWDIGAFIQPIVEGFQSFALAKNLRLELRLPEGLPDLYFDPEKLDTALCNLLSNACKFTDPGGVVLVKAEADEDQVRIVVKDNGIGIPADQLSKVFDRFHQVDSTSRRRYQGSGIGLALTKELVEAMGGRIHVESEEGFGSTFTVELPQGTDHIKDHSLIHAPQDDERHQADRARQAATALAAEVGLGGAELVGKAAALKPSTSDEDKPLVLVVEDSPDMRELVVEICRTSFRVIEAENGEEALGVLRDLSAERLPALVISDVMMPGMDGHELLVQLRADPRTAGIPVMLLTAKAGPERRIESLEIGADEYLTKPFDSRELVARARSLVRLKEQERQLRRLNQELEQLNAQLEGEVKRKTSEAQRARELGRYLPPPVVKAVLSQADGESVDLRYERRRLTLFLVELRGFEEVSESFEPEELAEELNGYLSEMLDLSFRHGATVDHFVLDRVSGFFGAPNSAGVSEDALRCAKMATEMWQRASAICSEWQLMKSRRPPVPVVVVHSGYAAVGNFGSKDHLDYTAVGQLVHEANVLLRAVGGGAACSPATFALIREAMQAEACGTVALRPRAQPVPVYRLAGEARVTRTSTERSLRAISVEPGADAVVFRSSLDIAKLDPGETVEGRYRIEKPLGIGGMGSVYRARDTKLDLDVALKLIHPELADARRINRLRSEVRLSRRVTHRNVARIYDIGDWAGGEFISMEYVEGETLDDRLGQAGPLAVGAAVEILRQLCAGLAAAHAAEVIHRDLKPSNVMLAPDGRVVILDFGLARAIAGSEMSRTRTGEFVGSPQWMAPEQVTGGEVDRRADIYSLGAVAFEMLTGRTLFEGETVLAVAFKQVSAPAPDPREVRPGLPEPLVELILRCLRKEPADRFGSIEEIAELLEQVAETLEAEAQPDGE
jgi:signal transduction histidine kinase/DNA-binding response OmpR family regulator/predicted Ser/Thr protein kinase